MTSNGRADSAPLYRVLGLLDRVKKSGAGYEASCPGSRHKHEDRKPSLNIGLGYDGRVLLNCKAGCDTTEVLAALELSWSDLLEQSAAGHPLRRFRLLNGQGAVVAEHLREDLPNDKRIWWEHAGKRGLNGVALADLPLYRLPEVLAADRNRPVIVTEGEKAAEALAELGLLAVGTATGAAGTPSEVVLSVLRDREVWLWPDNDIPGMEHMVRIAARLPAVRWIDWPDSPPKGDAADYVAAGGTAGGVSALLRPAPVAVAKPGPRLSMVRMSDVQPEPIEWLWRGRYARGKPTLIMGDPGQGKSLISHDGAARVSSGTAWPDGEACEQGTAILFTIEDGLADTVAPRLIAAGADMSRVIAIKGVIDKEASLAERMFALTEHVPLLEEMIMDEKAIYVAMDPITAYLGPDVNSHREADVRAVLGPLSLMAERTRIVLLMLMHLNKGTGVSALYRATGSIAFPAVARIVLGVAADPNDEDGKRRLLLPIKMNIGKVAEGIGYRIETAKSGVLKRVADEDQPPVMVWDLDPVTIDATAAMDRNGSVTELGAVADVKSALVQILADGRVMAREAERQLKEAGCSTNPTTVIRARRELGVASRRDGFQGPFWWELARPMAINESLSYSHTVNGVIGANDTPNGSNDSNDSNESLLLAREERNLRQPGEPLCPIHHVGWNAHECSAL